MITEIGTDILKAAALLSNDGLVAIPTETVYGLAGNALSETAIGKIYAAKNRPQFNPLIMHLPSIEMIEQYAEINSDQLQLLQEFMPGPLTVLLPKKNNVPDLLTAGSSKVAIRIPAHAVAHKLLTAIDFPLAAPSANPSGYVSPVTAQHVYEGLNGKIAYILEGGECNVGLESTIIEFRNDSIVVHRLGGLSIEQLQSKTDIPVRIETQKERPLTSGQLKSHYAPNTPLYLDNVQENITRFTGKKIAVISFYKRYEGIQITNYILSEGKDHTEAASKLFKTLRDIDAAGYDVILAEKFHEENLGAAINDRLSRAQQQYK